MNVGQICQREVDLATPSETVQAAAQRMAARNVGSLVIVDGDEHPIGILTDRDVALKIAGRALSPLETTVDEVMTPNPVSVRHTATIEEALSTMARKGVRRLPVIDGKSKLMGVLSFDDVLLALTQELAAARLLLEKESPRSLATGS